MFYKRQNWFKGSCTIQVKGDFPERFFDFCVRKGIQVWNVRRQNQTTCQGTIYVSDLSQIRRLKRETIYKIRLQKGQGFPFLVKATLRQKPLMIGSILAVLFIFILSNIVWKIEIEGLNEDLERKVTKQLESYGVYEGNFQWSLESPGVLQRKLLEDIPELLWVGISKTGVSYHLEGVEKTIVEESENTPASHLVAEKEGVVVDLYVEKGQPLVKQNDTVHVNERLISGILGEEEEMEEKDSDNPPVAAEGEVIAKVWYRSEVAIPLRDSYGVLTGDSENKYYVHASNKLFPIWNFRNPDYHDYQIEVEERSFYFLKWKLPFSFVKQTVYQKEKIEVDRTSKTAKTLALQQSRRKLRQEIGVDGEIIDEKILHEKEENGKVKITLYYTVEEDIVKRQPISQGD
ncbi:hypothetical protein J416_05833 [Gracilibacillus halophilus YIM-C55.5]|uniref:Stage IV sporulation protein n=1 Tax=Gracilibacillus halophilus YIM-C55.5 TaxID=1308866 RepID=N4WMY9_9BACI|nr:sporulation protein YqfD [Gracilibacillus halophilus]ENH97507.1 hypothetical protein J416_05833 [Gracilibacillus halophilus YIM-C55.5]